MIPEPFKDESIDTMERFKHLLETIFNEYDNLEKEQELFRVRHDFPVLAIIVEYLMTTTIFHMKSTNLLFATLERLPKTDEFNQVKQELKKIRSEALSALIPIKKLAQDLEESKNKKVDYIG